MIYDSGSVPAKSIFFSRGTSSCADMPCFYIIDSERGHALISYRVYELISVRESTPPQNRDFNILIGNSKHQVDDLEGMLTF